MRLAARERIDPDRISFVKVLKHVRRSVIRQCAQQRRWVPVIKGKSMLGCWPNDGQHFRG